MLHYLLEKLGCRSRPRRSMLEVRLGRAEASGALDESAGLFAKAKEGGAKEGVRKVREDWASLGHYPYNLTDANLGRNRPLLRACAGFRLPEH